MMSSETNEQNKETISATAPESEAGVHDRNREAGGFSGESAESSPASTPAEEALKAAHEAEQRYVRLYADFENFKRRAARERDEVRRSTTEGIVSRLLPVLDNFEMAMQAIRQPGASMSAVQVGVEMILGQIRTTLTDLGVEEVDALGKPFDPTLHDAVSQEETSTVPEGQVTQQTRKGYRLRERLIRPASVVVSKAPSSSGESADARTAPSDQTAPEPADN